MLARFTIRRATSIECSRLVGYRVKATLRGGKRCYPEINIKKVRQIKLHKNRVTLSVLVKRRKIPSFRYMQTLRILSYDKHRATSSLVADKHKLSCDNFVGKASYSYSRCGFGRKIVRFFFGRLHADTAGFVVRHKIVRHFPGYDIPIIQNIVYCNQN